MFEVYGKENCPYCAMALDALDLNSGEEYVYIDIDEDAASGEYIRSLGAKTVPQIFYYPDHRDNKQMIHVGGYEDLLEMFATPTEDDIF